jgi:signal transduction histidine kinase
MPEYAVHRGVVLLVAATLTVVSLTVPENSSALANVVSGASPFLFPVCLALGAWFAPRLGVPVLLVVVVAAEINQRYVNPFALMLSVGPWLVGAVVRSRREIAEQLELRAAELEAEREIFAAESVRYERARIARELHDIVAHCVSVTVIQAAAGQRAAAADPDLAREALDHIGEAVNQAQAEMARLVELLADPADANVDIGLDLVEELVTRARATGLPVSCRFVGRSDLLDATAAEAAYRVVQEALTNALKHAPGAQVTVESVELDGVLEISVVNSRPESDHLPLHTIGGGHGLRGMRERITSCGGDIDIGPTDEGGWRVAVRLPTDHRRIVEPVG